MPRRADMFIDLKDDPREDLQRLGDERTTLVETLRSVRMGRFRCARCRSNRSTSTRSHLGHVDLWRERIDGRIGQ
jgi:hypothetical protein